MPIVSGNALDLPIKIRVRGTLTDPVTLVTTLTPPSGSPSTRNWPTPASGNLVRNTVGDFLLVETGSVSGEYSLEVSGTVTIANVGTVAFRMPPVLFTLQ